MGEIGLDNFKQLCYGGVLFYMILSYADYLSYGDCAHVDVVFECNAVDRHNELVPGRIYSFFRCYEVKTGEEVGCYATDSPPTCLSPGLVIEGGGWEQTDEELYVQYNGGICKFPDGSNFTHVFPAEYDEEFAKQTGIVGELQCRIGYFTSGFATITVLVLLIGIFVDELWGVIDDNTKRPIWKKLRVPTYLATFSILVAGNAMVIYTHTVWVQVPPQSTMNQGLNPTSDTPCKTPSRIALLITLICSYLLAVEIGEALFNLWGLRKKAEAEGHHHKHNSHSM